MEPRPLTRKQQEILEYLVERCDPHITHASYRDIARHFGITTKGAYDHVSLLEKKGVVLRDKGSIIILKGE